MQDAIVIIPTYNEIENIEAIIDAVFNQCDEVHILVVDDNSPDKTAQKVESYQSKYSDRLFLVKRNGKQGLGTAYVEGFKWCLKRDYEFVFEMDADFSHDPKDLKRLYTVCKEDNIDLVVGSRYIKGVNVVNWPLSRVLLSYTASLYVRLITGMKVLDPTAGFVCYRRVVLEAINLDQIKFIGYAFQIEMKYITYKNKFKIKEIPIIFTDRLYGDSKLSKGIISEAIFGVLQMRLKFF
ncbi:MAG: polyprenol monophosphomannose synthase [Formosa sp.]|jgi:dolichol-phosphate mannosyltransferase|nr:polyprenol monophosphomannose synthase [Formosa sp.]